jgi:hypothetical protein
MCQLYYLVSYLRCKFDDENTNSPRKSCLLELEDFFPPFQRSLDVGFVTKVETKVETKAETGYGHFDL